MSSSSTKKTHGLLPEFDGGFSERSVGRKMKVRFKDGEEIVGTTQGYQPDRQGFFLVPADDRSNNDRCFVLAAATEDVSFL